MTSQYLSVSTPVRDHITKDEYDLLSESRKAKGLYFVRYPDGTTKVAINGEELDLGVQPRLTTSSEYAQFTDEEKHGLWAIADIPPVVLPNGALDVHTEEERLVGQWLDGKPLYKRTVVTTITSNTAAQSNVVVAPVIPGAEIKIMSFTNNRAVPDVVPGSVIGDLSYSIYYDPAKGFVFWSRNPAIFIGSIYIDASYTKTADSPFAGFPAFPDNVTNDEQIVGMYLDEIWYRKVFRGTLSAKSQVIANIANINRVISISGTCGLKQPNGTVANLQLPFAFSSTSMGSVYVSGNGDLTIQCTIDGVVNQVYNLAVTYTKNG